VPGVGHHDEFAAQGCPIHSASARGSGKSGSCSPITTRVGAETSLSRCSAGARVERRVSEAC
jgi:hypothetical protein